MFSALLAITVIFALLPNLQVEALTCFKQDETTQSSLQKTATNVTCKDFCSKMYRLRITNTTKLLTYELGCAHQDVEKFMLANMTSDSVYEYGEGSAGESKYERMCVCNTEHCNGADMNTKCNEEPKFTHQCYAAGKESKPDLPDDAFPIQCTETQSCFKFSQVSGEAENEAGYYWGCLTPPKVGQCNYSNSISDGEQRRTMCMCCGDKCNGAGMNSILAINGQCGGPDTLRPAPIAKEPVQCYVASGTSQALPKEARLKSCSPDETMCMKSYVLRNLKEGENETKVPTYLWGCAGGPTELAMFDEKCNSTVEFSKASRDFAGKEVTTYTRAYLCCGDACNGHALDEKANDVPTFTHQCYSTYRDEVTKDPNLPINATKVQCTERQACYKYSQYGNSSVYQWGCMTPPSGKNCTFSGSNANTLEKACMCCGDLCNNEAYNFVLANTYDCKINVTKRAAPELPPSLPGLFDISTEKVPIIWTEKDYPDATVIAVFSLATIGFVIIVLTLIFFCIRKKKSTARKSAKSAKSGKSGKTGKY